MKHDIRNEFVWPKPDIIERKPMDSITPWHGKRIEIEPWNKNSDCLHDHCDECHGSGRRRDGSACVHMISCPCPQCSPWSLGQTVRKYNSEVLFVDFGGDEPLRPRPAENWQFR